MNLIFLDFDGVLNDPYWLTRIWPLRKQRNFKFEFDMSRIEILACICDITNAKLVLSSSWNNRPGVKDYFESMGFTVAGQLGFYQERGDTIKKWLLAHPEYIGANYIIIDDEKADYDEEQLEHLVFTGSYVIKGWTEDNIHLAPLHVGLNRHDIYDSLKILVEERNNYAKLG